MFKSWVSHRIDDPALAFVTPPLKKDKKRTKKEEEMKNRLNPG
jgi:hypothetical protein